LAGPRVFSAEVVEKVTRLCRLLADIRIHPFLGPRLVLKGGTALNLFHLGMRRLSVDADFNYVGALDAETTAVERPSLLRALRAVAEGQGYRVREGAEVHASSALFLGYRNQRGSQDSLKLEVNYMHRASLGAAEEQSAELPFGGLVRFRLVSFPELVAGKLVALLDRTAARDLYDAAALADIVDPHDRRLRAVFVAMAGVLPRPIWEYTAQRIERVEDRDIREHLYPVLPADDRPTREGLLARVRPWLELWLTLDAAENEFHRKLGAGVLEGSLLFPADSALAAAVNQHPGLRWKVLNVAKMRAAQGDSSRS
jgi:predicted nucleotidyltransferase component of viral defense system